MRSKFGKRLILLFLVLVLLFSLGGCIPVTYDFDDIREENVQNVQFYDISGMEKDDRDTVLATEPFFILPDEQLDAFFEALKGIPFEKHILLIGPSDPSFRYGDYVVRINYGDGSFRLMSCEYHNESFDSEGNCESRDTYGCNVTAWNDLVDTFAGPRSSRIIFDDRDIVIPVAAHRRLTELLLSAKVLPGTPDCTIDQEDYIKSGNENYYLALGNRPFFMAGNTYFELTQTERDEINAILVEYAFRWRRGKAENPYDS